MSTTVIIEGDEERVSRDRRFVCPFCDTIFIGESTDYTLATFKEQADYGVTAFATCPTCEQTAVSPVGSGGEIATPAELLIQTLPAKCIYKPGDTLDLTGLVLAMRYSDGSIGTVAAADCTFSPADGATLIATDTAVTVTFTGTELTASIPLHVKNKYIPEVQPTNTQFTYSGSSQTVGVRYYNSDTSTAANNSKTNAGSYTATFTPKTGYCWPDGTTDAISIPWVIAKAVPVVVAPKKKLGLTYTGAAKALVTAGTTTGGTMKYKVGDGDWGTSVPTGTDAGSYTVSWKVDGGDNYEDNAGGSFTVAIAKATPVVSVTPATNLRYTGEAQNLIADSSTSVGTLEFKLSDSSEWSESSPTGTDVGNYHIEYRVQASDNWNAKTGSLSVAILKTTLTGTFSPNSFTLADTSTSDTITLVYPGDGEATFSTVLTPSFSGEHVSVSVLDKSSSYAEGYTTCTFKLKCTHSGGFTAEDRTVKVNADVTESDYYTDGILTLTGTLDLTP